MYKDLQTAQNSQRHRRYLSKRQKNDPHRFMGTVYYGCYYPLNKKEDALGWMASIVFDPIVNKKEGEKLRKNCALHFHNSAAQNWIPAARLLV